MAGKVSNNLRDFCGTGGGNGYSFESYIEHYFPQIIQEYSEKMSKYIGELLSQNRNIFSESGENNIKDVLGIPLHESFYNFGINNVPNIIDIDIEDKNIVLKDKPIIPGYDKIQYTIKLDSFVSIHRKYGYKNIFVELLEAYDKYYDECFSDSDKEACSRRLFEKIHDEIRDNDTNIVPISYCVPTKNKVDPKEKDSVYSKAMDIADDTDILSVYTHIDRAELYDNYNRCLINNLYFKNESGIYDYSSKKSFIKSVLEKLIVEVDTSETRVYLFKQYQANSYINEPTLFSTILRSCIGSINKYYNNIGIKGSKKIVIETLKKYAQDTNALHHSESVPSHHNADKTQYNGINDQPQSAMDAILGLNGVTNIFSSFVSDILRRNELFKNLGNTEGNKFEQLISHSILFIIISKTIHVDSDSFMDGLDNIVTTSYIGDKRADSENEKSHFEDYNKIVVKAVEYIMYNNVKMLFASFILKYYYDLVNKYGKLKATFAENVRLQEMLKYAKDLLNTGYDSSHAGSGFLLGNICVTQDKIMNSWKEDIVLYSKSISKNRDDGPTVSRRWSDMEHSYAVNDLVAGESSDGNMTIYDVEYLFRRLYNIPCVHALMRIFAIHRYEESVYNIGNISASVITGSDNRFAIQGAESLDINNMTEQDKIRKNELMKWDSVFSNKTGNIADILVKDIDFIGNLKTYTQTLINDSKFAKYTEDSVTAESIKYDVYKLALFSIEHNDGIPKENKGIIDATVQSVFSILG